MFLIKQKVNKRQNNPNFLIGVNMSQPVYIKVKGSTQGLISSGASTEASIGNRYQSGHEDEIMAQEVSHIVTVPTIRPKSP